MNVCRTYSDLRQGCVLNSQMLKELVTRPCLKFAFSEAKNDDICVVVSQDCDIVSDASSEPFLEFIVGNQIEKLDGNCQYGKNPRILHLSHKGVHYSFSIHQRFVINKKELELFPFSDDDEMLSVNDKRILKRWLGRRYTRAAFPDEFNRRLKKGSSAKLAGKEISANVSHVFFEVCDMELAADQVYELNVLVVVNKNLSDDKLDEIEKNYSDAFDVDGISLKLSVVGEDEVTLADLKTYRLWEKEGVSISKRHALPIEESDQFS